MLGEIARRASSASRAGVRRELIDRPAMAPFCDSTGGHKPEEELARPVKPLALAADVRGDLIDCGVVESWAQAVADNVPNLSMLRPRIEAPVDHEGVARMPPVICRHATFGDHAGRVAEPSGASPPALTARKGPLALPCADRWLGAPESAPLLGSAPRWKPLVNTRTFDRGAWCIWCGCICRCGTCSVPVGRGPRTGSTDGCRKTQPPDMWSMLGLRKTCLAVRSTLAPLLTLCRRPLSTLWTRPTPTWLLCAASLPDNLAVRILPSGGTDTVLCILRPASPRLELRPPSDDRECLNCGSVEADELDVDPFTSWLRTGETARTAGCKPRTGETDRKRSGAFNGAGGEALVGMEGRM